MVEHLGPNYFSPEDYNTIVQTVCSFAQNKSASLRQASAYGIGVIAQYGGHGFITHADFCLASLRSAVDYQMSAKVQEKKSKQDQFHHARDNAIASIGKVIKFQREYIQSRPELGPITKYWIDNLPITHDVQEGQL
jgi:importin-5